MSTQLARGSWLRKADTATGSYLQRPTAPWEETAGDPGRDGAWGAEHRGSHWLHLPLGTDPRPVAIIKVGPRLFLGCFLGNTAHPPCPAQAWVQGPQRPPCIPRPPALHHLSPGSQSKHWLLSQERQGEAQSIVCLLFLLLQQTSSGTSMPGAT